MLPSFRPEHILFDWDNTLVDSEAGCLKALNAMMTHFHLKPVSAEEYRVLPPYAMRDFFFKTLPEHQHGEALEVLQRVTRDPTLQKATPMPYAYDLLQSLQQRSIGLSVVSNKEGDLLRREIHEMGWNPFFTSIIGSGDSLENKPSPLPLYAAYGDISSKVWFVGDSFVDMDAAQAAGCTPLYVGDQPVDSPCIATSLQSILSHIQDHIPLS
mgnify:CR=1 FL=1